MCPFYPWKRAKALMYRTAEWSRDQQVHSIDEASGEAVGVGMDNAEA
jgi:hypothetical protein